jgi:RNA polymerase-associated protein LEO1
MASSSEEDVIDNVADIEDDLFGSEDGTSENKVHQLSDRELDSGDDEDQDDRAVEKADTEEMEDDASRNARVLDSTVWRHPLPQPFDGEVGLLFQTQIRDEVNDGAVQ